MKTSNQTDTLENRSPLIPLSETVPDAASKLPSTMIYSANGPRGTPTKTDQNIQRYGNCGRGVTDNDCCYHFSNADSSYDQRGGSQATSGKRPGSLLLHDSKPKRQRYNESDDFGWKSSARPLHPFPEKQLKGYGRQFSM